MVRTALVAALLALPSTALSQAVTPTELYLEAARGEVVKADEFTPTPTSKLLGRPFRIEIPYGRRFASGLEGAHGGWSYDADAERLTLRLRAPIYNTMAPFMLLRGRADPKDFFLYGFAIRTTASSRGSYVASNAFGVTREVSAGTSDDVAIAPYPESSWLRGRLGDEQIEVVSLPADKARSLTAKMQLRVEGIVTSFDGKRASICGSDYVTPTVDRPTSITMRHCLIAADIRRVEILFADGSVAAAWDNVPAQ